MLSAFSPPGAADKATEKSEKPEKPRPEPGRRRG